MEKIIIHSVVAILFFFFLYMLALCYRDFHPNYKTKSTSFLFIGGLFWLTSGFFMGEIVFDSYIIYGISRHPVPHTLLKNGSVSSQTLPMDKI